MSFDLNAANSVAEREEAGAVIHLRDEFEEPMYVGEGESQKPVTVKVVGSYSKTFRRAQEDLRRNMFKSKKNSDDDLFFKLQVKLLASCILSWDGIESNGQPFMLTRENATALLFAAPWIRQQVEDAINDHSLFKNA